MTTDPTTTTPATRAERRQQLRSAAGRIITPRLRRWGYGVAAAALAAAVGAGWLPPSALPWLLPLAAAVLFVDETGAPRS